MNAQNIAEFVLLGMLIGFIPQALGWACSKLMSLLDSL